MTHLCPNHPSIPAFGFSRCYTCLKDKALNGQKGTLTGDERTYVGVDDPRWQVTEDGTPTAWREAPADTPWADLDTELVETRGLRWAVGNSNGSSAPVGVGTGGSVVSDRLAWSETDPGDPADAERRDRQARGSRAKVRNHSR